MVLCDACLVTADLEVREITRVAAQDFLEEEWRLANQALFGKPFLWTYQGEFHLAAFQSDDQLLGVARFNIAEGVGKLLELVVRADRRGEGIGGRLLSSFERSCKERGCHKLYLDVASVNVGAKRFYQQHGWEFEGVMRRHWRKVDFENWCKWL